MCIWCGFSATEVTDKELEKISALGKVAEMPSHLLEGSIKVIDGVVVVKFTDAAE